MNQLTDRNRNRVRLLLTLWLAFLSLPTSAQRASAPDHHTPPRRHSVKRVRSRAPILQQEKRLRGLRIVTAACTGLIGWLVWCDVQQQQLNAALIEAIEQGDIKTVLSLLASRADPNATNNGGIKVSLEERFHLSLRRLVGQPLPPSPLAESALIRAVSGHLVEPEIILALLNKGADAHARNRWGDTALMALCIGRPMPRPIDSSVLPPEAPLVVKTLLDKGIDINARNSNGETALMMASDVGWTRTVALLLAKKAKVNVVAYSGTALCSAANNDHADIAEMLIARGANVNLADGQGQTPLSLAKRWPDSKVLPLLKAAGAKK